MTSSNNPNTFFAVLRRAVKAMTRQFLMSLPAIDVLDTLQDTFRAICESFMRKYLADRA